MSARQVPMYRIICDRCGVSAQEGDFYAWADEDQARCEAEESDWLTNEQGDWCNRCVIYDEAKDDYIPNPEPVAA